jgi:XTP/dITP diphosphohydrolase
MELVLATRNKGKIAEIKELLFDIPSLEILSLYDFERLPEIPETEETFMENAILKAKIMSVLTGHWALADDSGLVVDYLEGAPGVYSARFAGEDATDVDNNTKLLSLLDDIAWEQRQARFVCAIALSYPHGRFYTCEGQCEGYIATELKGENGFGYDPLFFVPAYGKTMAELGLEIKNQISHRGKALRQLRSLLQKILTKR